MGQADEIANCHSIIKDFKFEHLPSNLQDISKPFSVLAQHIMDRVPLGRQAYESLRSLLQAKDSAVRAVLNP